MNRDKKKCSTCGEEKELTDFPKSNANKTGRKASCKLCAKQKRKEHYVKNKIIEIASAYKWQSENLEKYNKNRKLHRENNLWLSHYTNAKQRCENTNNPKYKNYGGRGIRFLLTKEETKELWERDKGWLLKLPSIDREDNNGNYEFDNCRFIELSENSRRKRGF